MSLSATERNKMLRDLKLDSAGPDLSNFDYPKDYDLLCMDFSMQNFHLNLTGDFKGMTAQVLCMQLSNVHGSFANRLDSQKITLSIDGLTIFDPCTHPKRLEHRIVRQRENIHQMSRSNAFTAEDTAQDVDKKADGAINDAGKYEEHSLKEALQYNSTEKRRHSNNSNSCIFSLTVELFSNIDAKFQTCIRLVSGPLELVYSPIALVA